MSELTYLSWREIEYCCIKLVEQIKTMDFKVDAIVTILRGGCVPGVIVSHLLDVDDCYAIGIRTTSSELIKAQRLEKPKLQIPETLFCIKGKNVLIIDDVTNTGNTLDFAKREIAKFCPNHCLSAVLVWDGDNSLECKADIYAMHTPSWVVFPWEVVKEGRF